MELIVAADVLGHNELLISSTVVVDLFPLRLYKLRFGFFVLDKLLLFVELLSPASVGDPVVAFIVGEYVFYDFGIFVTEFAGLGFSLLDELDPVVE